MGTVNWASSAAPTILIAFIGKNGVSVQPYPRNKPAATATTGSAQVSAIVEMNGTTDYVELYGNQVSGGALSTQASGGVNSVLELEYLGVQ